MHQLQRYNDIPFSYRISSGLSWPTVCIFSGVHGNEPSGIDALHMLLHDFESWKHSLLQGTLLLVIGANQEAMELWQRFVEYDMNRLFGIDKPTCYEWKRVVELESLINESDFLIDLHSTSKPSVPFMFSELQHQSFVENLWVSHVIYGWWALGWVTVGDAESYANQQWCVSVTYESGDHRSPDGRQNASAFVLSVLQSTWLLWWETKGMEWENQKDFHVYLEGFYTAKTGDFSYAIAAENFLPIDKDTLIWRDGWEDIFLPAWTILVMPKSEDAIHQWKEAFFRWKKV